MAFAAIIIVILGILLMLYESFFRSKLLTIRAYPYYFSAYLLLIIGLAVWLYSGADLHTNLVLNLTLDENLAPVISSLSQLLWPFVALMVAILFRGVIASTLNRVTSAVLPGGSKIQLTKSSEQPTEPSHSSISGTVADSAHLKPLVDMEAELTEYQRTRVAELQVLYDRLPPHERERRLILFTGRLQIEFEYENIFSSIFGTQVNALRAIKAANEAINLKVFHESHLKKLADRLPNEVAKATFEKWANFLITNGLITSDSSDIEKFSLTQKGNEFVSLTESRHIVSAL